MMFTPTNIATEEEIAKYCTEIQNFLESHYESDNPNACVLRGQQAEQYMALTSKLLADANYIKESILNSKFIEAVKTGQERKMSPSTLNKYIDSLTAEQNYLVNWVDRLNRACTHTLDFQRTILSKLKAEMQLTGKF